MPEILVVRLPAEHDDPASWVVVDHAGTRVSAVEHGPLANAAAHQEQRRVVVLVPAAQVVVTRTQVPVRGAAKIQQAVPFALEDSLAGDVSDLHFAIGKRDMNGMVEVAFAADSLMNEWTGRLAEASIRPASLLPETAGIPATESGITVLIEGDEAFIRDANGNVSPTDLDTVADVLALLVDEQFADDDGPIAFNLQVLLDETSGDEREKLINDLYEHYPSAEFKRLPNGTLARLAAECLASTIPNMLSGEYAPQSDVRKHWLPWRGAAMAAAALAAVTIGVKATELVVMKSRASELREEMREVYRLVQPDAGNIPDPRGQLESMLGRTGRTPGGQSVFLDGLTALSGAIEQDTGTVVQGMSFRNGMMDLKVSAPDVQSLDKLRIEISDDTGWQAVITSTRPSDSAVEGRLELRRVQ